MEGRINSTQAILEILQIQLQETADGVSAGAQNYQSLLKYISQNKTIPEFVDSIAQDADKQKK